MISGEGNVDRGVRVAIKPEQGFEIDDHTWSYCLARFCEITV